MATTSKITMAKKFIAPLMNEYTFQGVVNKVSDSRFGDECIEGEYMNISEMLKFMQDHENANFVYNFIEENKNEIIDNIYDESFQSEYMENIREFWAENFHVDEYDMWSFLHMHLTHDEYFADIMHGRFIDIITHDRKYYSYKYLGYHGPKGSKIKRPYLSNDLIEYLDWDNDEGIHRIDKIIKAMMKEFTKEQICKLFPLTRGYASHDLKEDKIECIIQ